MCKQCEDMLDDSLPRLIMEAQRRLLSMGFDPKENIGAAIHWKIVPELPGGRLLESMPVSNAPELSFAHGFNALPDEPKIALIANEFFHTYYAREIAIITAEVATAAT